MPAPGNISSFQSFSGLENNNQVFIPNMHNLCAPLNELLKKDKGWEWTPECYDAFVKIKKSLDVGLVSHPLWPGHYSCQWCQLAWHWSIYSAQNTRWISQISCSRIENTSSCRKEFSQIDEVLGIIFTVMKFHRYIPGRYFILQTDHKPLLTIFGSKKSLPVHTANRLRK